MMTQNSDPSTAAPWARFRFSVVGSLSSSPPARGELKAALRCLAARTWTHPVNGGEARFAAATIERWYSRRGVRRTTPWASCARAVRKDCGKVSLTAGLIEQLVKHYRDHQHGSYRLHYGTPLAFGIPPRCAVCDYRPKLSPWRRGYACPKMGMVQFSGCLGNTCGCRERTPCRSVRLGTARSPFPTGRGSVTLV